MSKGFTLIEMMLVLVIAALMGGVVAPNLMPTIAAARFRSAVNDVVSGLRVVRSDALIQGRESVFVLDIERHGYQLSGKSRVYILPDSIELALFTAEQERQGKKQGGIRFYPDGSSTGGRITLTGAGRSEYVDVSWLTGAIVARHAGS
jgi:general secretion pathway protein H